MVGYQIGWFHQIWKLIPRHPGPPKLRFGIPWPQKTSRSNTRVETPQFRYGSLMLISGNLEPPPLFATTLKPTVVQVFGRLYDDQGPSSKYWRGLYQKGPIFGWGAGADGAVDDDLPFLDDVYPIDIVGAKGWCIFLNVWCWDICGCPGKEFRIKGGRISRVFHPKISHL